ncbi:hypothetical protein HJ107_24560 [Vibrio parahaemolyticus]|nr:hypothetical protein [Vibrio parahaemolyticus]MBE4089925.1 hypothetical protein [Vibrio parahaemolyticus]HAS6966960.1 hypothetical protein [Vibrio parahaemolyticus]
MSKRISIQVSLEDKELIDLVNSIEEFESSCIESSSFDGQSEVMTLILSLSTLTLPLLAKIYIEHIKSKKSIKLIYKGVQVQGVSEKTILKVLKEIESEDK